MTATGVIALFGAMLVLAAIPGPGVVAVAARSASAGFSHGAVTALGIVLGDYVFILLSMSGLSFIAETMGGVFSAVKYLGATYLVWLGIKLIRSRSAIGELEGVRETSYTANLLVGLFTTLGNPKAILFYLSFFPAFLDMTRVSGTEMAVVLLVATLAVGGVMLGYALLASRAGALVQNGKSSRPANLIGGGVLIGGGIYLGARS